MPHLVPSQERHLVPRYRGGAVRWFEAVCAEEEEEGRAMFGRRRR